MNVRIQGVKRMFKTIVLIAIGVVNLTAEAQFKCVQNGVTSFQDTPCNASQKAEKIAIQPASGHARMELTTDAPKDGNVRFKEYTDKLAIERQIFEKNIQISRIEEFKVNETNRAESAIYKLKQKKLQANNNLAGAVWEQSLSGEMQAVTAELNAKISDANRNIETLQKEVVELKRGLK